jgi:hypothetical protein
MINNTININKINNYLSSQIFDDKKDNDWQMRGSSLASILSSSSCYVPLYLKLCLAQTYPLLLEDHKYHLLF